LHFLSVISVDKKLFPVIVMGMKVRFLKPVAVDVETRFAEIEDRSFNKWDEIKVNEFIDLGNRASLVLENNDTLIEVPKSVFEVLDK